MTLGSVASLLAATLYQRNHDRNHTHRNIELTVTEIYFIYKCCWNVATYKWKDHKGKIDITSFVVKFRSQHALTVNFEV